MRSPLFESRPFCCLCATKLVLINAQPVDVHVYWIRRTLQAKAKGPREVAPDDIRMYSMTGYTACLSAPLDSPSLRASPPHPVPILVRFPKTPSRIPDGFMIAKTSAPAFPFSRLPIAAPLAIRQGSVTRSRSRLRSQHYRNPLAMPRGHA